MDFVKRKGNSGRTGEKRRRRHCGEIASHRNFDRLFGWPNDLRFDSDFEGVLYSRRGTILRWPIMFLTVEFLDLWQGNITLKLKFNVFSFEKNCKSCHYELSRKYGCCMNFSGLFEIFVIAGNCFWLIINCFELLKIIRRVEKF